MKITRRPHVIYLSMSPFPEELRVVPGLSWSFVKTTDELQAALEVCEKEVFVVVRFSMLTVRALETFLKWGRLNLKAHFIFLVQTIEDRAQTDLRVNARIMVVVEGEANCSIAELVQKRIFGVSVEARRETRIAVTSPVIIKKSSLVAEDMPGVQFLREGAMQDFSRGGARLRVLGGGVSKKDFVSVMYRDTNGSWVAVDSQVRWVRNLESGQQVVGVQFLAVNA